MKLYNGDCLNIISEIKAESIDLIIIDPPYNINYKTNYRKNWHRFKAPIMNDDKNIVSRAFLDELYRTLKPNSACYIFWSIKTYSQLYDSIMKSKFNYKNTIVWVKNNWSAGDLRAGYGQRYELIVYLNKGRAEFKGKRLSDVWFFDRVSGKSQLHQNQKPLDLLERIILKHSSEGDTILDCFMGSGSTGVACQNLNRHFIGIELDKEYYKIAVDRLNKKEKE